jgi:FkbM family methyltransferase
MKTSSEVLVRALGSFFLPLLRGAVRYGPAQLEEPLWRLARATGLPYGPRAFCVRSRGGFRYCDNQETMMARCIYWFGHWEPTISAWMLRKLSPGDTFVDVGAHLGYFSLLAARAVGRSGTVLAFEPTPTTFGRLCLQLAVNNCDNVIPMRQAVGWRACSTRLYEAPWDPAENSLVPQDRLRAAGVVDVVRLVDAIPSGAIRRCSLVKVDVEGGEVGVLRGLLDTLEAFPAHTTFAVEVHAHLLAEQNTTPAELIEPFLQRGFVSRWLELAPYEEAHLRAAGNPDRKMHLGPASQRMAYCVLTRSKRVSRHVR